MATGEKQLKAAEVLLDRIIEQVHDLSPAQLLQLAEAFAWVHRPAESHGGGAGATAGGM